MDETETCGRDYKRHVLDIPLDERLDRCQDGVCKIDSPHDLRPSEFHHGAFTREPLPANDQIDYRTGRVTETADLRND